jgi:hypothetical protein
MLELVEGLRRAVEESVTLVVERHLASNADCVDQLRSEGSVKCLYIPSLDSPAEKWTSVRWCRRRE